MNFLLSPGNDSDIKHAKSLVEGVRNIRIVADKGYIRLVKKLTLKTDPSKLARIGVCHSLMTF